jgi:hypothetical protein
MIFFQKAIFVTLTAFRKAGCGEEGDRKITKSANFSPSIIDMEVKLDVALTAH